METNRLYKIAESKGVSVFFTPLPHTKAFSITVGSKRYIALDKCVGSDSAEERVLMAHELGHQMTDSLYDISTPAIYRKRFERRAESWAIEKLVPLSELCSAIRNGDDSVPYLAEHFAVTEDFMRRAMTYYREKLDN